MFVWLDILAHAKKLAKRMSERTVTDSVPGHMETRPKLIRLSSRRSIPSAKKASGGGPMTSDKSSPCCPS